MHNWNGEIPDSGTLIIYIIDEHSQRYGEIEETFRAVTKDDILQPYISEHDFGSSHKNNDNVYSL